MASNQVKTVDDYIAKYPENIQELLQELRNVIRESALQAEETISYQIPTFKLNGNLVHFGASKIISHSFPPRQERRRLRRKSLTTKEEEELFSFRWTNQFLMV